MLPASWFGDQGFLIRIPHGGVLAGEKSSRYVPVTRSTPNEHLLKKILELWHIDGSWGKKNTLYLI